MDVQLLNGRTERLKLTKHPRRRERSESRSGFQHDVGCALAALFPREIICEEVPVTGERFVLDFFVPSLRMVVECHGRQHYQHVPWFHGGRAGFNRQQERDSRKQQWCELNNFAFVEVPYGTDADGVRRLIRGEHAECEGTN